MATLRAPRFFGDDVLESCLSGHRIFQGSGDPQETIARIQRALSDLGFSLSVDGIFGPETGAAVTSYKTGKGLVPNDPVVGPGTSAALDDDFANELFDAKAAEFAGTRFDLGARTGSRVDVEDGLALCAFENGTCIEGGHVRAFLLPAVVFAAWTTAGGLDGTFGAPVGDPRELDASRSVQEFAEVAFVFGPTLAFAVSRPIWEASVAGRSLVGLVTGPSVPVGDDGTTSTPHDLGVVLAVPSRSPQAMPQAVFDAWSTRTAAGTSPGAPIGFPFPTEAGLVFQFSLGDLTLSGVGTVS